MPIYAYRCPNGHEADAQRSPKEANTPIDCPQCGEPAQRLHRLGGVSFRGTGFHNTDYPRQGAPPADSD